MADRVAVILPWQGGCEHRARAWAWVRDRYAERHPDWPITVAELAYGDWCKAAAVMPAALATDAEVLVIADADVWCDQLPPAVASVRAGRWAVPHRLVHRLTKQATEGLLAGAEAEELSTERHPYNGIVGGGIVVLHRRLLEQVPLDSRFVGWGDEDIAWGYALTTIAGPPWRGTAPLIHLWHPPQRRIHIGLGSRASAQLRTQYSLARTSRSRMQALIEGGLHGHS